MGPGLFFDLEKGETVDSMVYQNQILLGPLQQFWEDSFEDGTLPIVMEDNAPVYKKVCIPAREALGVKYLCFTRFGFKVQGEQVRGVRLQGQARSLCKVLALYQVRVQGSGFRVNRFKV